MQFALTDPERLITHGVIIYPIGDINHDYM